MDLLPTKETLHIMFQSLSIYVLLNRLFVNKRISREHKIFLIFILCSRESLLLPLSSLLSWASYLAQVPQFESLQIN